MAEIRLNRRQEVALVDDDRFEELSRYVWGLNRAGYVRRVERRGDGKYHDVLMHRQVIGAGKGQIVDHRNQNKLDNRAENLRFCTHQQNIWNVKNTRNTSGYRGVTWSNKDRVWCVFMRVDGRCRYFGAYHDINDAIARRREIEDLYCGEFSPGDRGRISL
jgi:hypothetical protein